MKILFLIALLCLTGCQSGEELATPKGPVFPLNVGHWQPTVSDFQAS